MNGPTLPTDELAKVESSLTAAGHYVAMRVAPFSEDAMDEQRTHAEAYSGRCLFDPNLWQRIIVDVAGPGELAALINSLNDLDIVELAWPVPGSSPDGIAPGAKPWPTADSVADNEVGLPLPAGGAVAHAHGGRVAVPPRMTAELRTISDFTAQQIYRRPAAEFGIDADWLRSRYWVHGHNVNLADIESEWITTHREFPQTGSYPLLLGVPGYEPGSPTSWLEASHGTATLGVIISAEDNLGTEGITPFLDEVHLAALDFSPTGPEVAERIYAAVPELYGPGGVLLIERDIDALASCDGIPGLDVGEGHDRLPVEDEPTAHAAIVWATAGGRTVVEPAGNGGCDLAVLDPADSGAIIVGAGYRSTLTRVTGTNYGTRVDVHAEGANSSGSAVVVSPGYGDKHPGYTPPTPPSWSTKNEWYTDTFRDTSSASAIVAGAVAYLNSIAQSYYGLPLSPMEMRQLLKEWGTPQGSGVHIGPRPDLKKQIAFVHNRALAVRSSRYTFYVSGQPVVGDYLNWDPITGKWTTYDRLTGQQSTATFGGPQNIPVPGEYDQGNGTTGDLVTYRWETGQWWRSVGGGFGVLLGTTSAYGIPVPLEYQPSVYGLELAVYMPPPFMTGTPEAEWRIRWYNPLHGWSTAVVKWGYEFDVPLVGDFDGDGHDDLVRFHSHGSDPAWFHVLKYPYTLTDASLQLDFQFGHPGDIPFICRRNNSAHPTEAIRVAVFSPSTGKLSMRVPEVQGGVVETIAGFGEAGDIPACVDTNNDGNDEFVVWRPRVKGWRNWTYGWSYPSGVPVHAYALGK